MFTEVGDKPVIITKMKITMPKFNRTNPAAFALCFAVHHRDDPAQADNVYLDVCEDYGKGNFATQKQVDVAADKLRALGFPEGNLYDGAYLSTLRDEAPGKSATVHFEAENYEGKTYIRAKYFVTSAKVEELSAEDLANRLRLLVGGAKADPAPAATAKPNPFAPKSKTPF
jgi:hypothetical protein